MGGDFNCAHSPLDFTNDFRPCKTLEVLIQNYRMKESWTNTPTGRLYTHYTPTCALIIDRVFISSDTIPYKIDTKIVATFFCDHFAVIMRAKMNVPQTIQSRRSWKVNSHFLEVRNISNSCCQRWATWKLQHRYTDILHWWETCAKQKIRSFYLYEGKRKGH
jgi:hypothetical protein